MRNCLEKLKQNKGASLVEILVSLAVSAIVFIVVGMFVSNGTNFFNRQSRTIDLQKELLEVSNKVNDSIMQATGIEMYYNTSGDQSDGFALYTGEITADKKNFLTGKGNASKKIEWGGKDNKKLYVLDDLTLTTADEKEPYKFGSRVTNFSITFSDECATLLADGTYMYEQPLILEIHITVADDKESRSDTRVVTLRNQIEKLVIDGNEYVKDGDVLRRK